MHNRANQKENGSGNVDPACRLNKNLDKSGMLDEDVCLEESQPVGRGGNVFGAANSQTQAII